MRAPQNAVWRLARLAAMFHLAVDPEVLVLHEQGTDAELQDSIVENIRRKPEFRGFAAELTFVRLHSPSPAGATWVVFTVTGVREWSTACRHAFETAVRHAQRAFDLLD
jgi:hypothetical protein